MWLEAKHKKRMAGKVRRIGERFECPVNSAMALQAHGLARQVPGPHPPVDRDAALSAPEPEPETTPEPEPETSADDERLAILVGRAIANGKMPALIDALSAVGLNPDDYSNNGKREAALHAWLES